MKYVLQIKDNYGIFKACTELPFIGINSLEITEEQYNEILCPCSINIRDNKLIRWEACELPNNLFQEEEVVVEKSPIELLQERILQLEVAEVNRKSTEIEKQIMGGI